MGHPGQTLRAVVQPKHTIVHKFRCGTLRDPPVSVQIDEVERAKALTQLGVSAMDALHLACAESGGADIFLTTDDRLLRQTKRLSAQLRVRVANPLTWIEEISET